MFISDSGVGEEKQIIDKMASLNKLCQSLMRLKVGETTQRMCLSKNLGKFCFFQSWYEEDGGCFLGQMGRI